MAPMAAVSCENMRARLNRGSAMVMMIRMIAMTISNSIREKPRRRRCRFIIQSLPLFYDVAGLFCVEATWLGAVSTLRQRAERKVSNREIPGVVGEQGELVVNSYCRNDDVAEVERGPLGSSAIGGLRAGPLGSLRSDGPRSQSRR